MSDAVYSPSVAWTPHVAWTLRAATLAMKAKVGSPRVSFADIVDLAQLQVTVLPEDGASACAMMRFLARFDDDPIAAGVELFEFATTWREDEIGAAVERIDAALAEMCPMPVSVREAADARDAAGRERPVMPVVHAWQTRADTGLD